jgi:hypothetical protein
MLHHSSEPAPQRSHHKERAWCPVESLSEGKFSRANLDQLLRGEVGALILPNFLTETQALQTAGALDSSSLQSNYKTLRDRLTKIGSTLYENLGGKDPSPETIREYLENAAAFSAAIEEICAEFGQSPMSRLQQLLGSKLGARKLEFAGKEAFAGLVRVVRKGNEILPHQDELGEDMPSLDFAQRLKEPGGQFAVNVYLQVPEQGGELQLWRQRYTAGQMANMRLASSDYGIDPALLPLPDAVIKPKVGDLILFDSSRMHAVAKSFGIPRVSISMFLGVASTGEARYWS